MRFGLVRIGVVVSLLAFGLIAAGCGARGNLENPGAKSEPQEGTATADSGQGKKEGEGAKPHKPFILDGLLR